MQCKFYVIKEDLPGDVWVATKEQHDKLFASSFAQECTVVGEFTVTVMPEITDTENVTWPAHMTFNVKPPTGFKLNLVVKDPVRICLICGGEVDDHGSMDNHEPEESND